MVATLVHVLAVSGTSPRISTLGSRVNNAARSPIICPTANPTDDMREIGTIENEQSARRFQAWLQTLDVSAQVEIDNGHWAVWIYDEDDIDRARSELESFVANPDDARYVQAEGKAAEIQKQTARQAIAVRKRVINVRDGWERPMSVAAPVTFALIALSVATVVVTTDWQSPLRFADRENSMLRYIWIAEPVDPNGSRIWSPADPLHEVMRGQIWRIVTPIFVHMGILHLLFNMMFIRSLGAALEMHRGSRRYLAIVLTISVCSNLGQLFAAGPLFGGMSGVLYGLFGYAWTKGRFEPSAGIHVDSNTTMWLTVWFFVCLFNIVGPVANTAHAVGAATGAAIAIAPVVWRRFA